MKKDRATKALVIIAVILGMAVLKVTQAIAVPIILSFFLTFLLYPLIRFFKRRKASLTLASVLSLLTVLLGAGVLVTLLMMSLRSLETALPSYTERIQLHLDSMLGWFAAQGVSINSDFIQSSISPGAVAKILGSWMVSFLSVLSNLLLIFFMTLFMLLEGARFEEKAEEAFAEGHELTSAVSGITTQIQRYLGWKTAISFTTGFLVWLLCALTGIDFALLWGLLAFLLNYIPSVGSILASIPPIIITLVQFDNPLPYTLGLGAGLLAIQVTMGNIVEPRLMGRSLNLSPLVIFISMIFWGWMWGAIGMLISVPLMVSLKVVLVHFEGTRGLAKMLEG